MQNQTRRALGAERAIDYQSTRFEAVAHDVDVVLDTVGGDTQDRSWPVPRPGEVLISVVSPPAQEKAAAQGARAVFLGMEATADLLHQVTDLITAGQIRPEVGPTCALADAGHAQALSQQGHGRGQIILHVAG